MNPENIYDDIHEYCKANANEAIVKKYSRYFKEGYNAFGLTTELMGKKVNELVKEKNIDFRTVIKASQKLIPSEKYEEVSFAILLFKEFKKQYTPDSFSEIEKWFSIGINNWAHTDVICGELLSTFLEKKIISYTSLDKWRSAQNKFQRRAVPVALIKLLKYTNDYQPFFNFIEPLMMDQEREVHQGLGWFLREAWKKHPEQTEMFLMQWKDTAPRLIFQYATERMKPEQKQHFKRVKGNK